MDEKKLQWLVGLKLLVISIFSYLYSDGGRSGKWKRRYIAPCILVTAFVVIMSLGIGFSWIPLLSIPLLIGSLSLGYGGDKLGTKLFKRSYVALAHCVALLPMYVVTGAWLVYVTHCILITSFMVVFGVWNPLRARDEEAVIGLSICLLPLFTI